MFKLKKHLFLFKIVLFICLGLFLITNNHKVMAMDKDIPSTSNKHQKNDNSTIEEIIINLKNQIRENAVKKTNTEKELNTLSNNDLRRNNLLVLKQRLTDLINNQKEQLKTYQILLKNLND